MILKTLPKLLDLINTFIRVAGYKINIQNQYIFHIPTINRLRKKIRKILFKIVSKNYIGIHLTKDVKDHNNENYRTWKR
jgi:hypothetical protein